LGCSYLYETGQAAAIGKERVTRFLVRRADGEFPGIERDVEERSGNWLERFANAGISMNTTSISDEAKAVVRRNTEEVQGQGKFEVFEELFADDFVATRRSLEQLQTRPACASFTHTCGKRFLTFAPKSTGSLLMAIA
jgi:hypothetical protein